MSLLGYKSDRVFSIIIMISRVRLVYTCTWFIERLDIVGVKAT